MRAAPLSKTHVPVVGEEVTLLAVHNDDVENPVDTEQCTTDATGTCSVTLDGVSDGDVIWGANVNSNTVQETVVLQGIVSTFTGSFLSFLSVDGTGTEAGFMSPRGLAIDATGTNLYVGEFTGSKIRRVRIADAVVTTLVGAPSGSFQDGDLDGVGTSARIRNPEGLVVDPDDDFLYIADAGNLKIRRTDLATGQTTIFAGPPEGNQSSGCVDGSSTNARFISPFALVIDPAGENLYVADGHRVRKIVIATGVTQTAFGAPCSAGDGSGFVDGTGSSVRFNGLAGITMDANVIYVSDNGNNVIRKIDIASGAVTTVIGSTSGTAGDQDGEGTAARLNGPTGITLDPSGKLLYIEDTTNNKIRRVVISENFDTEILVGPLAGAADFACTDGTGSDARFSFPIMLAVAPDGAALYVTDFGCNSVRKIE